MTNNTFFRTLHKYWSDFILVEPTVLNDISLSFNGLKSVAIIFVGATPLFIRLPIVPIAIGIGGGGRTYEKCTRKSSYNQHY